MTARLYVDLTTSSQEIGRHAHGTTRVERGIVACLARQETPDVEFVAYNQTTGRFAVIPAEEAGRIATAPTVQDPGRELEREWRRHPLVMRARLLRRRLRARWRSRPRDAPPVAAVDLPVDDPIDSGSTLFLPSEHHRQDFAYLMRLKRDKKLRLVFLFYDLLRVLDDDDPRLWNPLAADLPQTDFMVREAALVLAISRHSAGELRGHMKRRGVVGPPVVPVRLAGELPSLRGPGSAVPGLEPGRFVLCVGDVVHRKNHALLVKVWRSWAEQDPVLPLVVVGRISEEGDQLVRSVAQDAVLRERIRFIANADDRALAWLYAHCRFTVFPSLLEGFGLPVAESLAYGKVCIASTATSIPEAGQGVAIGLDPHDADAWLDAVRRFSRDDAALAEQEARISRDFRPATWQDTVDDILGAIAAMDSVASKSQRPALPGVLDWA